MSEFAACVANGVVVGGNGCVEVEVVMCEGGGVEFSCDCFVLEAEVGFAWRLCEGVVCFAEE